MSSLLDKIRSEAPPTSRRISVVGFDPDFRHCGFAEICAEIEVGIVIKPTIIKATVMVITAHNQKLVSIDQACAMTESIHMWYNSPAHPLRIAFVESQQVYADQNMDRSELVGKANDLLRLAHIAGAFHMKVIQQFFQVEVLKPAEWKGNKPKETMHDSISEVMKGKAFAADRPIDLQEWRKKKLNGHAMDALCLAHKGLSMICQGVVKLDGLTP